MKRKKQYHAQKSLKLIRKFFPKVERVIDAKAIAIVEVTQGDVDVSNIKSHDTCALAVACKRTFHSDGVIIGLTTSYIITSKTAIRYKLADTISREITSFDRKAGFDIGFYLLSPFPPSAQLGRYHAPDPRTDTHTKNTPDRRKFRHFTGRVRTVLNQV